MARKESFITIQGWMATELKLSGNELLVYALIYGFSQDGESEFRGSINYICGWLNCTRPTASKALSNLVEKGLITKTTKIENNMTFNRYKIILGGVKNLYGGGKETLQGGSKETLHHNIVLDNIENNINIPFSVFWDLYDKKVGYNEKLKKKWESLKDEEREKAIQHIPKYKLATPDKQYRKNPETYLNNKSFNDEIVGVKSIPILSENPNAIELNQIMAQYGITMPDHIANKHWDTRVDYVRRILAVKTKGNVSNFD